MIPIRSTRSTTRSARSSVTRSKPGPQSTASRGAADRVDLVVARAAEQPVGVEAAVTMSSPSSPRRTSAPRAALELVVAGAALERVVARVAEQRSLPAVAEQRVVAVVAADVVVAVAAARTSLPSWPLIESASDAAAEPVVGLGAVDRLVLGLHGDRLEDRRARRAAGRLAEVRRAAQAVEARVVERRVADDRALAAAAAGATRTSVGSASSSAGST